MMWESSNWIYTKFVFHCQLFLRTQVPWSFYNHHITEESPKTMVILWSGRPLRSAFLDFYWCVFLYDYICLETDFTQEKVIFIQQQKSPIPPAHFEILAHSFSVL